MKHEECVQERYHLVMNLVSELRDIQEKLNELGKIKDEEGVHQKDHLVENLVSELREMQEQLNELGKIKMEYEIAVSQRILMEKNFHKVRAFLEEQLAEREAEIDRLRSERLREVREWKKRLEYNFYFFMGRNLLHKK